ncbi:MAG: lolD1 [Rickettsiales bacterium]|jgi:lipoprotein-releasing system ATP-binding protein|nr:lolD1 [Rickettsiales bacterium]
MPEIILSLEHIEKSFHQGSETLTVLADVSLSIAKGEMVALVGQSGTGKSTLLQIAGLLDSPTSGKITINGTDCSQANDSKRTRIRKNSLGFVYQFHHLLPEFSALENVMMPLLIDKQPHKEAAATAEEMLEKLGLANRLTHRPSELSGGEQQRVAIARALVHRPQLLLADEPTGNLDPATSNTVFSVLVDAVKSLELSAFIVTHNPELARKMDRVVSLKEGKLTIQS